MGLEIERKFLVTSEDWRAAEATYLCQGYLHADRERTVRVRLAGEQGTLTIKGPTVGAVRPEFEYPISASDARELLELCRRPFIVKYRRELVCDGVRWEVDEFLAENQGLVLAEVELDDPRQEVVLPSWVGDEVTSDPRYHNSQLAKRPFSTWS